MPSSSAGNDSIEHSPGHLPPPFESQSDHTFQDGRYPTYRRELTDPYRYKDFNKQRKLVLFQGLGSGILMLLFVWLILQTIDSGSFGALCLLILFLIILLVIAILFYLITFITAAALSLRGQGLPFYRRVIGFLPLGTLAMMFLVGRLLLQLGPPVSSDNLDPFYFTTFWLGVSLVYLNAALFIPAAHLQELRACQVISFLPPIMYILSELLLSPGDDINWFILSAPLGAFISGLIIYYLMGQVVRQYSIPQMQDFPSSSYPKNET